MAYVVDAPTLIEEMPSATPLTPYLARIADEQDRTAFEEAVRAASAGAMRSAYVMVWVACVESLRRKFTELSARDVTAQRALEEIDGPEGARSGDDAVVLEEARAFGFVTDMEYTKLSHLFAMRGVYARPGNDPPGPEALAAAASDAVEIVLGRGTKLKLGYLKEQLRLITTEPKFLEDSQEVVARHAADVHAKASDELHLWFVQSICRAAETYCGDPSAAMMVRRGVWFLSAFLSAAPAGSIGKIDFVADLSKYPSTLSEVLTSTDIFPSLSPHTQDIVVGLTLASEARRPIHLKRLEALHAAGAMTPRQVERFAFAIESMSLAAVASVGLDASYYAALIVRELKSRDWHRQNAAIEVMKNVGRERVAKMPEPLQRALGNNLLQAADGMAREAVTMLEELARTNEAWSRPFIEGIVEELLVNDSNAVRFKARYAREAFLTLRTLSETERGTIVLRLVERIKKGTWVAKVFFAKEVEAIMDILQNVAVLDADVFRSLRPLSDVLAASKKHHA